MKRFIKLLLLMAIPTVAVAQNDDDFFDRSGFEEFRKAVHDDFQNFRNKVMEEYIEFVRNAWQEFEAKPPIEAPDERPLPPDVIPDEGDGKPIENVRIPIDDIIPLPTVTPQPLPVEPIKEVPVENVKFVNFSFFGTNGRVRFDVEDRVTLCGTDEDAVADALRLMAARSHDNMIVDCLRIRSELNLSDWAYINMLETLSKRIYGNDVNGATLLMAYIYMQSGYKMRFAQADDKLYMLFASKHLIYNKNYYNIDGYNYYSLDELPARINICKADFEKEQPLSLIVQGEQKFAFKPTETVRVAAADYPSFEIDFVVNRNLLDFYGTIPTSMIGDNQYTRWAMYANTPMDDRVCRTLYPKIAQKLEGLSEFEVANRLINLVQTGYVYKYDDVVWGGDRVFFPDESLFYKYNDCDDRSVLFSRLVRDLMGVNAALVFVPRHVLVAVEFESEIKGSYIMIDGRKFILCEPTNKYGIPVGLCDIKDGENLDVILLEKNPSMVQYKIDMKSAR